jgi:cyclophilin family peptidyl-prolyl cis-trans isomerase
MSYEKHLTRTSARAVETLEPRRHLNGNLLLVNNVVADNRGEVLITLSAPALNVNKNTIRAFRSGADGVLGTSDDVRYTDLTVRYDQTRNRITIRFNSDVNAVYRVRLSDEIRLASNNSRLDGEFNAGAVSGNGTAGGNFHFLTRRDRSATPRLRFSTTAGIIDVRLRGDISGIATTVSNFVDYANAGRLDGTIWHRKVRTETSGIGIAQGGGFYSTAEASNGSFFEPSDEVEKFNDGIPLQAGFLSNLRGTLAMARTNQPNTATSQFYFNATDNTVLDPTGPNTGYAVFAQVVNGTGLTTLDAIYNASTTSVGQSGVFTTLPRINNQDIVTRRVALQMKVFAAE